MLSFGLWLTVGLGVGALAVPRVLLAINALFLRLEGTHWSAAEAQARLDEKILQRAWLRWLLKLTVWAVSVLVCVSFPLVLALSVATVLYEAMQMPSPSIKALLAASATGAFSLLSMIRGRNFFPPIRPLGHLVTDADEPRLFAALVEVADAMGMRMVDRVIMTAAPTVGVNDDGPLWEVLAGRGERTLLLGFPLVRELSSSELKALVAQTYCRFRHGDLRLLAIKKRGESSLMGMAVAIKYPYLNPMFWVARPCARMQIELAGHELRLSRLQADQTAAQLYGGEVLASALVGLARSSERYSRVVEPLLTYMRGLDVPCRDVYRCVDAMEEQSPRLLREFRFHSFWNRDTAEEHKQIPASRVRVARIRGIAPQLTQDDSPALSLIARPGEMAEELTSVIGHENDARLMAKGHVLHPVPDAMDVAFQERTACAIAACWDACEMGKEGFPTAPDALLFAARELESVIEYPNVLALLLKRIAKVQHELGRISDARATYLRVIEILEAEPETGEGETQQLQKLVQHLVTVDAVRAQQMEEWLPVEAASNCDVEDVEGAVEHYSLLAEYLVALLHVPVPSVFESTPESLADIDAHFWEENFPESFERWKIDESTVPLVGAFLGEVLVRRLGGQWVPRARLEESQVRVGDSVCLPFVRAYRYMRSRQALREHSLSQFYVEAEIRCSGMRSIN
ncbi:M48 family metallopeptidase [Myxococcus fulvus]|uniref:M48 family metallopeptidase n=1 Tax=Myxococcus fulvus TaxID=33 RepID=UPI003B9999D7